MKKLGGSPGLVVMGGDSCSVGHGFVYLLGWTFIQLYLLRFCVCLKRGKYKNEKEAGDLPI